MHWANLGNWRQSAINTLWCLLGCSIGDLGTIAIVSRWFPQFTERSPLAVMAMATAAGIATSILLETVIMIRQMPLARAFRTAIGMSLISMIAMEVAMNATDFILVGGARLVWWVVPLMLLAGFLTALPYNYWRLEKWGRSCCGN